MARRTYQAGSVFQKGLNKSDVWDATAPAYGRYWQDQPGTARTRVVIPLGFCRTRTIAKRKLAEQLEKIGVNSTKMFVESTTRITFNSQAEIWLKSLSQRKRAPLEQTTIDRCRYVLDKHLSQFFGDMYLGDVNNLQLKNFVEHIATLAPATIRDYAGMVKAVVASAVDQNGEQLFPRTWNAGYIDAPMVRHQRQPSADGSTLESILAEATDKYRVLYALLAGCGPMRIGEALGLEIDKHISPDYHTLYIRQKAKRGVIQGYLKTAAGERDIDLCSSLATMLREFIGQRTTGLLFSTSTGKQLLQQDVLRDSLHPILKRVGHAQGGFNIFRRFRLTHLEKMDCRDALKHFWAGHAPAHVSERYIKLVGERDYRLKEAERIGTGFQVPKVGQPGQLIIIPRVA